ncbi:MAG: LytTR family DNA-binding domain-containing protein [Rhodothermales bacterium]
MLRVLIVDDEPLARRGIRARLQHVPGVTVVGEAGHAEAALTLLHREQPDLLFLDIQMPGANGFDLLAAIDPAQRPAVIFLTAYETHALQAFEVHALDYLLKPIDDDRFYDAIRRAKTQRAQRASTDTTASTARLAVKEAGRVHLIAPADIDWVEAAGDYVCLHIGPRRHLLRDTLTSLADRLNAQQFVRIHRSTIVNLDRIQTLHPLPNGEHELVLHDGTRLKQSRTYRNNLSPLFGSAS